MMSRLPWCGLHRPPVWMRGAAALLQACALGVGPAAAERLFATPYVPHVVGSSAGQVRVADITGDRVADIVYVGHESDSYGDGSPSIGSLIGPPVETAFPTRSFVGFGQGSIQAMTVDDLNGDGKADIVAILDPRYSGELLWVGLGRSDPAGFEFHAEVPVSGRPISVASGDLDGDGRPDVAVARMYSDSVSIFTGRGDGALVQSRGIAVGSPWKLALGDVDGDGRLDVVVVDTGGTVLVFLSEGEGGFRRHSSRHVGGLMDRIGLADFDGDARLDLIVPGGVLLGDGAGNFGPTLSHGVNGVFAAGDFNADGRPDLAVVSNAGLLVLAGRGDGTFAQAATYDIGGSDVAAGDLDQDGDLDLTVAAKVIATFHGNGDGTFGRDIPSYPVGRRPVAITTGDLNGDGRADVAVANQMSNTVSILTGAAGGTLLPGRDLLTGVGPVALVLADFDQDGDLDLAVAQQGPRTVSIFAGSGDGTFGSPAVVPIVTGVPSSLGTGDLDEDGFPDLAVADGSRTVSVLFGGPGGIAASGRRLVVPFYHAGYRLEVTEITGDGHLDIVLQGEDVGYVPGRGDGTFGAGDGQSGPDYGYFYSLATIDLCNNCTRQVLAGSYCCILTNGGDDYYLDRVFGNGCGGPYGEVSAPPGESIAVGDLDGDGMDDLATPSGTMTVLLGNGRGWFGSRHDFGVGRGVGALAVEDLDGDARPDLVLAQVERDRIMVLYNQSTRPNVPEAPGRVTALAGAASVELSWDPVEHPDLAGYRVSYDLRSSALLVGTEAREGPSPIEVPVGQATLTLHCLPESTLWVRVTAVDRWGRESECTPLASAHPGPVGGEFSFVGGSLSTASHGRWAMGLIQLDHGISAADVVPGTVTVNGVGPADPLGLADRDHDGRDELMIRFSRSAVDAIGGGARVRVEGRVAGCRDTLRFVADDSVRIRRPEARPHAGAPDAPAVAVGSGLAFALHPVVPSPARSGCSIAFDLPEHASVRLSVFDLRGRMVSSVLARDLPAGAHRVWWERRGLPDGVYFVRIEAGSFRAARGMALRH